MKFRTCSLSLLLAGMAPAMAAELADCVGIDRPDERLRCYDRAAGRDRLTADSVNMEQSGAPRPDARVRARDARGSTLSERWELAEADKRGTFLFRPHKPVYLMPLRWSDDPNRAPRGATQRSTPASPIEMKPVEAKFQLSFKAKMLENVFGDIGDLWFGYTQQAHWQVYNKSESAPFRESVYEPEIMAVWRTDIDVFGLRWRMLNIGLNHQSNGRTEPFSRSWNRVYAEFGLEGQSFALLIRPWLRIPEEEGNDDNRDIEDFVGRGEVRAIWKREGHIVSLGLRHSLNNAKSRGAASMDWAFPIRGYLTGYLQLFTGYGESLIDYNHRQTVLGVGVSLAQWL